MKTNFNFFAFAFVALFMTSCQENDNETTFTVNSLKYIGEQVIPDGTEYEGTLVGGLSSIDYANGKYYMISDDANAPVRFYEATLEFDSNTFSSANITNVTKIKGANGAFTDKQVDPEALRYDTKADNFVWASEGFINNDINPSIRTIKSNGDQIEELSLPSMFQINEVPEEGMRHNGTFEGISLDSENNGYWLAMELPLIQDGETSKLSNTDAPVRISHIDTNGTLLNQYVYKLDDIARDSNPAGGFKVNGIVEILAVSQTEFLVLERSFAVGHADGGNNVKIYKISTETATDVKAISSLANAEYTPVTKELIFDFETIRTKLTDGVVDNIEGITFGKELPNGNRSLVLVADNNFSAFGPQLNQFVVFEVNPEIVAEIK